MAGLKGRRREAAKGSFSHMGKAAGALGSLEQHNPLREDQMTCC